MPRRKRDRGTGNRNELAAGLEHPQRFLKRLWALTIQHKIVARKDLLEILCVVVDNNICSESSDLFGTLCARGSRDCCAEMLGELLVIVPTPPEPA